MVWSLRGTSSWGYSEFSNIAAVLEHQGLCSGSQGFPLGLDWTSALIPKDCCFKVDSHQKVFIVWSIRLTNQIFVGLFPLSSGYLFVLVSETFSVALQWIIMFNAAVIDPKPKSPKTGGGNNKSMKTTTVIPPSKQSILKQQETMKLIRETSRETTLKHGLCF